MKRIKKHWFFILLGLITLMRFLLSFRLPSFYLANLRYDDLLMVNQMKSLLNGKYLGTYSDLTLIKGVFYPVSLAISQLLHLSYSTFFTLLYISGCAYFTHSLKKVIPNKYFLLLIYVALLFNPISYSSELFQRLYRNGLSISQLLFFFGSVISILTSRKRIWIYYILLGLTCSMMYLTREDTIWTVLILVFLLGYKVYKNHHWKSIVWNLVPIIIIFLSLNLVSFINYKKYQVYSYNELSDSAFKDAYVKILQIKDDEKKDRTAIPKTTLYKLAEASDVFPLSKEEVDLVYKKLVKQNGEFDNGHMVWYFRTWMVWKKEFKTGKEANDFYQALADDIERLFEEGKLEREFAIPSIFFNLPTKNEIKQFPKNFLKTMWFTSNYKNVKTFSEQDFASYEEGVYDKRGQAYGVLYQDYRNVDNLFPSAGFIYDFLRIVYQGFTLVFSFVAFGIYLKNFKKWDLLNIMTHLIVLAYLLILGGVAYTHTTAFNAIRYCYLGNVYILQTIFIWLCLARAFKNQTKRLKKLLPKWIKKCILN